MIISLNNYSKYETQRRNVEFREMFCKESKWKAL